MSDKNRPSRTPEAIALRREANRRTLHEFALGGITPNAETLWLREQVVEGWLTEEEYRERVLTMIDKPEGWGGGVRPPNDIKVISEDDPNRTIPIKPRNAMN